MAIYKDCTLFELLAVSIGWLVGASSVLSLLTYLLFGYTLIGTSMAVLSMVHVSRFLLGRLQKVKYGKPYGYYQHLFLKKVARIGLVQIFWQPPQILREGKWSVRRRTHEL
jgi:conjugative transfer region protein (TIGR03750 family)